MVTAVSKSANNTLGLLIAKHNAFGAMPKDIYRKLYDAHLTPIIEYAAVFGANKNSAILVLFKIELVDISWVFQCILQMLQCQGTWVGKQQVID